MAGIVLSQAEAEQKGVFAVRVVLGATAGLMKPKLAVEGEGWLVGCANFEEPDGGEREHVREKRVGDALAAPMGMHGKVEDLAFVVDDAVSEKADEDAAAFGDEFGGRDGALGRERSVTQESLDGGVIGGSAGADA
jgi:hypothetical protein